MSMAEKLKHAREHFEYAWGCEDPEPAIHGILRSMYQLLDVVESQQRTIEELTARNGGRG